MNRQVVIFFLLFLSCGCNANTKNLQSKNQNPDVEKYYTLGNYNLMVINNYPEAEKYYKMALSIDSIHYYSLAELGVVYMRQNKIDECFGYLNKAITIDSGKDLAYMNRGIAYGMFYKDYNKALLDFNMACKNNPQESDNFRFQFTALHYLKKYEEALESINKAINLKPNDYFLLSLKGDVLHQLGKFDESHKILSQSIELNSDYPRVYFLRARTYLSMNKKGLACKDYNKYLTLGGGQETILTNTCK